MKTEKQTMNALREFLHDLPYQMKYETNGKDTYIFYICQPLFIGEYVAERVVYLINDKQKILIKAETGEIATKALFLRKILRKEKVKSRIGETNYLGGL